MTAQQIDSTAPSPPMPEPPPLAVQAKGRSRLEQLHAAYGPAKAAKDEAEKNLKAITDAIKVELTQLDPNQRKFELFSKPDAGVRPLRLTYVESWRVDSTRLKAEQPEVYVAFAKQSGSWRLVEGS